MSQEMCLFPVMLNIEELFGSNAWSLVKGTRGEMKSPKLFMRFMGTSMSLLAILTQNLIHQAPLKCQRK